jgi:hypothetical protein
MFNCRKFYEDHRIDYYDGEYQHKHCRPGWIQKECPFCSGNPGLHLGYNEISGYFKCWRCGYHSIDEVIRTLIGVSWSHAKELKRGYGGRAHRQKPIFGPKYKDIQVALPEGTGPMKKAHKEYLRQREFNPAILEDIWDVLGTGKTGKYKNRIIAPIYHKGELVSYQGRDITGKSDIRYKACEKENEKILHQEVLYGYDLTDKTSVVVVEGITDAWRLGPGAAGTFGLGVSAGQLKLLSEFKNIFVLRDFTDPQALVEAESLVAELSILGKHAEMIWIEKGTDPADLTQQEADWLMRELLF